MISGRHRTRGRLPDETEALQTDIMRFLAIVCMCLMIVFSLVQSLPVAEADNQPKIKNREMMLQEIQNLEERAERLTRQLKNLENRIQKEQQTLEQQQETMKKKQADIKTLDRTAKTMALEIEKKQAHLDAMGTMIRDAQKQTDQYRELARDARQALSVIRPDLDHTNRLIEQGRQELKQAGIDTAKAQNAMKTLEIQNKSAERPAPAQAQKTKPSETKQSQAPRTPAPSDARPNTSSWKEPVREEKEGFSLGFRSNQELMDLLKHGNRAALFLISGNKSWKLNVSPAGRLSFRPSGSPGQFYEMDRPTVPESIVRVGKRVVAAFGTEDVIYGVTLSPEITDRFNALMKGQKGGDLVISSTGRVVLE